jgi:hypothetical protein
MERFSRRDFRYAEGDFIAIFPAFANGSKRYSNSNWSQSCGSREDCRKSVPNPFGGAEFPGKAKKTGSCPVGRVSTRNSYFVNYIRLVDSPVQQFLNQSIRAYRCGC